jgi:hypothetical protein
MITHLPQEKEKGSFRRGRGRSVAGIRERRFDKEGYACKRAQAKQRLSRLLETAQALPYRAGR